MTYLFTSKMWIIFEEHFSKIRCIKGHFSFGRNTNGRCPFLVVRHYETFSECTETEREETRKTLQPFMNQLSECMSLVEEIFMD